MSNQRFPAKRRLLNSIEFDAVFRKADVRVSESAFLLLAKQNTQGFNRLGMVIGKKHIARAVDRNRIKRQIREVFRKTSSNEANALDIVVVARPGLRNKQQLSPVLERSFEKLREKQQGWAS